MVIPPVFIFFPNSPLLTKLFRQYYYIEILILPSVILQKSRPPYKQCRGVCTMNIDGAKKSAKPPALRSLLPTDEALEMNI